MTPDATGPCVTCGNVYDKAFDVKVAGGETYRFDSFECAIHKLAPVCASCGCRIVGHGVESSRGIYCGVHCAKDEGERGLRDRVE